MTTLRTARREGGRQGAGAARRDEARWHHYAGLCRALPCDDRSGLGQVLADRPKAAPGRDCDVYSPDCAPVAEMAGVATNGHSFHRKDRRLHYAYDWDGRRHPCRTRRGFRGCPATMPT